MKKSRTAEQEERLIELRRMIEIFDRDFIQTLAQRLEVCREIGRFKKKEGITVKDTEREKELLMLHTTWAVEFGVEPAVVAAIFSLVLDESRSAQENIS